MDIEELLRTTVAAKASDLHLTVGAPPTIRLHGEMQKLPYPELTRDVLHMMMVGILRGDQQNVFEEKHDLDFSIEIPHLARFRVNFFMGRRGEGAVFRVIPAEIKSFAELGLPPVLAEMAREERGLVLVTGPTGSGKSTTLAAMVDLPDPVGPVTKTSPRSSRAISARTGGRPSSANDLISVGMTRKTAPSPRRPIKKLTRKRARCGISMLKSRSCFSSKTFCWSPRRIPTIIMCKTSRVSSG